MGTSKNALVNRLADVDSVVEVGVGNRPNVAAGLAARGVDVTATDIRERRVPTAVKFVRDDVTDPTLSVYESADIVFARNCPPELQRPVRDVARRVGAACWFTTLGGDPAVVPVETEQLAGGVTLYRTVGRG
ncbi:UPF0146 family protein [Haloarcula onubensis]|uniref:UPF0146 protein NDI86_01820 n=1 Tax=Haloarcula onubensis TaxID=2950539 RepID=A0ABU2FKE7_9EURY|nr:UPF0146 family protein [Halomicroarcula sp. S3CR25-11]MDS0280841.1 UPF0146 family protein [Halomicroarcula sp. S3CR25-11]